MKYPSLEIILETTPKEELVDKIAKMIHSAASDGYHNGYRRGWTTAQYGTQTIKDQFNTWWEQSVSNALISHD